MRIAFYTASMGGAGHLLHALAVDRGLRRAGFTGAYRVVAPPVPYPVAHGLDVVEGLIPRHTWRSAQQVMQTAAAQALVDFDPDVLLVDMFWAPLTHVLPALRGEAWLLLHTVPRTWLAGPLMNRFRADRFTRVLATEPMRHHPDLERIEPVVVCNPDECQFLPALPSALIHPLHNVCATCAILGVDRYFHATCS